jgi:hypothetical protein
MKEIINKLKNMSFISELRDGSCNTESKRHLKIEIKKSLIEKEDSMPQLYELLYSQSFFEWTINISNDE